MRKPEFGLGWKERSLFLLFIKDDYRQRFTSIIAFPLLPSTTVLMKDRVKISEKPNMTIREKKWFK